MERLEACTDFMNRLVIGYNREHEDLQIQFVVGKSETKADNIYTIRALIQKAMQSRQEQEG
jgi:hypothetical protein